MTAFSLDLIACVTAETERHLARLDDDEPADLRRELACRVYDSRSDTEDLIIAAVGLAYTLLLLAADRVDCEPLEVLQRIAMKYAAEDAEAS
jgi:hypothetical protein